VLYSSLFVQNNLLFYQIIINIEMKNFFLKIKILKFIFNNIKDVDISNQKEMNIKINLEDL
jgi:hypothetical protein